jgi:hypothetical protein
MSVRKEMLETMCLVANGLHTGETTRVNHEHCPSGADTKRRFYVTRKPDVLLGYCHNCQNSVTKYVGSEDRYRHEARPHIVHKDPEFNIPIAVSFNDDDNIPVEAHTWRVSNALSRAMCVSNRIMFSPEYFGIVTPVYNMEHKIGYQVRPLVQRGPKYITMLEDDKLMGGFRIQSGKYKQNLPVVITEDYISAAHVHEAGYLAHCNYGVQTKPRILYAMANYFGTVRPYIVWLDNDSNHVRDKANEIADVLRMFGATVYVELQAEDPKYVNDDIDSIVGSHIL